MPPFANSCTESVKLTPELFYIIGYMFAAIFEITVCRN